MPGKEWGEAIVDAIASARVFVLIFSGHANQSRQVPREIERAVHHGLPVIPFRIEDIAPSRSLEYFMSTPHWLDALSPPLKQHLDHLGDVVARLLSPEGAAEAEQRVWSPPDHASGRVRPLVTLAAIGLVAAAVPLVFIVSESEPPWPIGIGWLSALLLLASPFTARAGLALPRWLVWAAGIVALMALAAYLVLNSLFVEPVPGTGLRVVRGFVCTPDAVLVYGDACPDLPREALQDAEWEAVALWTRGSVTIARTGLTGAWLVFVLALAAVIAGMAARWKRGR